MLIQRIAPGWTSAGASDYRDYFLRRVAWAAPDMALARRQLSALGRFPHFDLNSPEPFVRDVWL